VNTKQRENILKYIADFLRTFGGAMIFVALSAIVFSKEDANTHPLGTALFVIFGLITLLIGLWFSYESSSEPGE